MLLFSNNSHTKHRQVIAGFCTVTMVLDCRMQHLYRLFRTLKGCRLQRLNQAFVAELLMLAVLCLIQTVGVNEQRAVADVSNLLTFIVRIISMNSGFPSLMSNGGLCPALQKYR